MSTAGGPYVIGISAYFHDSAAALLRGREIVAAAQEERFTRKKGDHRFPEAAVAYCRTQLPPGKDVDAVAFYESPLVKMDRILGTASTGPILERSVDAACGIR